MGLASCAAICSTDGAFAALVRPNTFTRSCNDFCAVNKDDVIVLLGSILLLLLFLSVIAPPIVASPNVFPFLVLLLLAFPLTVFPASSSSFRIVLFPFVIFAHASSMLATSPPGSLRSVVFVFFFVFFAFIGSPFLFPCPFPVSVLSRNATRRLSFNSFFPNSPSKGNPKCAKSPDLIGSSSSSSSSGFDDCDFERLFDLFFFGPSALLFPSFDASVLNKLSNCASNSSNPTSDTDTPNRSTTSDDHLCSAAFCWPSSSSRGPNAMSSSSSAASASSIFCLSFCAAAATSSEALVVLVFFVFLFGGIFLSLSQNESPLLLK
mmetsp:Transcript_2963/g.9135  ORF Transcript_2963/g.9135 Transcript_2963/m.9135 type:complete len:321 (-) Transcript_2963:128-1090(-)